MTLEDPNCPQCGGRPDVTFASGVAYCEDCRVRWDTESEEVLVDVESDALRELVAEADDRESWLSVPGVDWESDGGGIHEISIRGEAGPFIVNCEREDAGVNIHSFDDETVTMYGSTEDDEYGFGLSVTPDEAERIARQLAVAAHAARERGGTDVRT